MARCGNLAGVAGRIPQSFINDLVQRVDIVAVIDARVPLRKAGKNHKACCPFHKEKTPSFNVEGERGFYKCFGCGASGTALTFLMEHDHLEFVEAVEALARLAGVEVPREGGGVARPQAQEGLYELLAKAARLYRRALAKHAEGERAIAYLRERGLDGEIAQRFDIGFAPPGWDFLKSALGAPVPELVAAGLVVQRDEGNTYDRLRDRIVFPIRDTRGRVVGFGGRALPGEDPGPKYLNSPETPVFQKAQELYGLYEARSAKGPRLQRLVVVEGYMDVVALAQHGVLNAVATLGTAVGGSHFQKLYRNVPEVVCCFDGDEAGRAAAWRAVEAGLPALQEGRQLRFAFLPDGEDPDSHIRNVGQAGFTALVESAVSAEDYLVQRLSQGRDLSTLGDRAVLGDLAKPLLALLPPGTHKEALRSRLAQLVDVAPAALDVAPEETAAAPSRRSPRPAHAAQDSALGQRLLGHLMRDPGLCQSLDEGLASALLDADEDSLFLRVMRQTAKSPATQPVELLASFLNDPAYDTLRDLAQAPPMLDGAAVADEFAEGVARYVRERRDAERRKLAVELREDSSIETLARYWRARRERDQPAARTGS